MELRIEVLRKEIELLPLAQQKLLTAAIVKAIQLQAEKSKSKK